MIKLPEPDSELDGTRYHSDDQIVEYGNARAVEAVTQAFERAAQHNAPGAEPLEVLVDRGRVWLRRGHQSFMLDYDSKVPLELHWYANQLRGMLALPVRPDDADQA